MTIKQRPDLTFKDNLSKGRHGWLRLTPAYSVRLVERILDEHPALQRILDPFSGTGTTGLVTAQRGLACDLFDINPFLIWLAEVKCANYNAHSLSRAEMAASEIIDHARRIEDDAELWFPPISHIERWWSPHRLIVLAKVFRALNDLLPAPCPEKDLLLIAFCRLVIQWSNAAFNHQSMSFKGESRQPYLFADDELIFQIFESDVREIIQAARLDVPGEARVFLQDSRTIPEDLVGAYDAVITSPPYSNRMSYIRELRPYMYWLGYLKAARDAGELDWEAIGGTWGIATSRLMNWEPNNGHSTLPRLEPLLTEIGQSSPVLRQYVHKYFSDMAEHFASMYRALTPDGRLFYVVGNSKFYDTLLPVDALYADLMHQSGFVDIHSEVIRKRSSKKELVEFLISARKPLG
ncbi:MAG: DNA adenine methylase [Anaerolineae bacterium]|nr:DNA adenine methylase [Anaerolineae bacterium]